MYMDQDLLSTVDGLYTPLIIWPQSRQSTKYLPYPPKFYFLPPLRVLPLHCLFGFILSEKLFLNGYQIAENAEKNHFGGIHLILFQYSPNQQYPYNQLIMNYKPNMFPGYFSCFSSSLDQNLLNALNQVMNIINTFKN